jgi:hypothetical protein
MKNWIKEWWLNVERVYRIHLNINILELTFNFGLELLNCNVAFWAHGINWITRNYRLFSKAKQLDNQHYLEWEGFWSPNFRTGFDFRYSIHSDHAGWYYEICILGFMFCITKYDTRHWDYNLGTWKT